MKVSVRVLENQNKSCWQHQITCKKFKQFEQRKTKSKGEQSDLCGLEQVTLKPTALSRPLLDPFAANPGTMVWANKMRKRGCLRKQLVGKITFFFCFLDLLHSLLGKLYSKNSAFCKKLEGFQRVLGKLNTQIKIIIIYQTKLNNVVMFIINH